MAKWKNLRTGVRFLKNCSSWKDFDHTKAEKLLYWKPTLPAISYQLSDTTFLKLIYIVDSPRNGTSFKERLLNIAQILILHREIGLCGEE
jgi:hypothetical protein